MSAPVYPKHANEIFYYNLFWLEISNEKLIELFGTWTIDPSFRVQSNNMWDYASSCGELVINYRKSMDLFMVMLGCVSVDSIFKVWNYDWIKQLLTKDKNYYLYIKHIFGKIVASGSQDSKNKIIDIMRDVRSSQVELYDQFMDDFPQLARKKNK